MKKTVLRKYARLIARTGARVQKGQQVLLTAELDQPEFVKMVVEECYKAGASRVIVDWTYQPLTRPNVRFRTLKSLSTVEKWEEEKLRWMTEVLPCRIFLCSEDPDGLAGVNQEKMAKGIQGRQKIVKPYRDAIEGKHQWCIAAVPGEAWAKKVFPKERTSRAVELLWQAILATVRVDEQGDPEAEWAAHNKDLRERCDYLNSLGIESLHYTASNGTDFTVGMIPEGKFNGGEDVTQSGNWFNANMPTEECFISPKKGVAEGIVYSSKPLSYQGQLIDNFSIRFEKGKAVEVHAEQNEELLKKLICMDEGAAYLGECALVPYESPVRKSGLLFYNTLFDENAACHLALGMGFIDTIRDYEKYTLDELHEMGVNDSIIHEDFMIGTADLSITARCRDGREVAVFRNGTWAF
ncbi:MAG: aminopeptidase [Oscillospiraceae bacterium]|nr:aminopeptidase [Oscillospiraceae bacterium]